VNRERALELVDEVDALIARYLAGFRERVGYEPGNQQVQLACEEENSSVLVEEFGDRLPAEVKDFFEVVARLSLPDFWNGYFVGPPSWSVKVHRYREPLMVQLESTPIEVMAVGSDGGGTLYVVPIPEGGPVYQLPPSGIDDGVYEPWMAPPIIATGFDDFIERLVSGLHGIADAQLPGPFHY